MTLQLVIGSLVIASTVAVEAWFIGAAIVVLQRLGSRLVGSRPILKIVGALIAMTLWLTAALTVAVWIWALLFRVLGVFSAFEESLYFSAVAFTTLGFGDITLDREWRLLSGLIAANGLILFGLNTAFLIEAMARIRRAQNTAGADQSA